MENVLGRLIMENGVNILIGLTVLAGIVITLFLALNFKRDKITTGLGPKILGVLAITIALASSYQALFNKSPKPLEILTVVGGAVVFPVMVLVKLLVFYLIITIAGGLFRPGRITEFGAKLWGMEINQKYTPGEVKAVAKGLDLLEQQFKLINDLNAAILEFLARPYEEMIINAPQPADSIRQTVKDLLVRTYQTFPAVRIEVIPLTPEGIGELDKRLGAIVRLLAMDGVDLETIENNTIGIGIHQGSEGLATAIIIDTTGAGYEIATAEICAAGTLFVAVATTIDWTLRAREKKDGV